LPAEGDPYAARQLLRLGTDVEVLAPASLRAAVARRVAQRHEKSRPKAAFS
jgi:predicted DNA-binding transcriptional regulator YafY